MKRTLIIIAGFISVFVLTALGSPKQAGKIRITFTGRDVTSGSVVILDSVRVQNLLTYRDTVLFSPFIIDFDITTGNNDRFSALPTTLELSGNFANPFNDVTKFQITCAQSGLIDVGLYSMLGGQVASLQMDITNGKHEFSIDGRTLPVGVYILIARDGKNARSVRIVKNGITLSGKPSIKYINSFNVTMSQSYPKVSSNTAYRFIGYSSIYSPAPVLYSPAKDTTIEFHFINKSDSGIVTDINGNVYHTVKIGTQVWLVENLKTTRYNDGTAILLVTKNTTWGDYYSSTPAYCWYNNDAATNKDVYGALYNWYAVNTGKLCPTGWHVPNDNEWTTLTNYLGGEYYAGAKMKEAGTTHWKSPNAGSTNSSGFSALPGGSRNGSTGNGTNDGKFVGTWVIGSWWSSTEDQSVNVFAWYRAVTYDNFSVHNSNTFKNCGFSVRCVRD